MGKREFMVSTLQGFVELVMPKSPRGERIDLGIKFDCKEWLKDRAIVCTRNKRNVDWMG